MQAFRETFPYTLFSITITQQITPSFQIGSSVPVFEHAGTTATFEIDGDEKLFASIDEQFGKWMKMTAQRGSMSFTGGMKMSRSYVINEASLRNWREYYDIQFMKALEEELSKKQEQ